jgi:transposase
MARIVEAVTRYRSGRMSCTEAAAFLGMSERHFRRLRDRYEAEGAEGIVDNRLGRASARRAPVDEVAWVVETFRTRYWDFTVKHFHEVMVREHGLARGYTWTKTALQSAGAIKRAPRRSVHRKKRVRRPLEGMLVFQDGSTHRWMPGVEREFDLVATMDDATGTLYSAFLTDEEGTASSFRGLLEVIGGHGLFSALYTDRGSHYFHTPKAGGPVDKSKPTQVGRALQQLGIEHIPSYSPEARGRMERLFGTLQGRLPQELRIAGITTLEDANRYVREVFIPRFNAQFAVTAAEPDTAFVAYVGRPLEDILCVQDERRVGRDNTVRYNGLCLQIPEQRHRHHFVDATVRVHEYPDASLAIFHGPRRLARYHSDGTLETEENEEKSAA